MSWTSSKRLAASALSRSWPPSQLKTEETLSRRSSTPARRVARLAEGIPTARVEPIPSEHLMQRFVVCGRGFCAVADVHDQGKRPAGPERASGFGPTGLRGDPVECSGREYGIEDLFRQGDLLESPEVELDGAGVSDALACERDPCSHRDQPHPPGVDARRALRSACRSRNQPPAPVTPPLVKQSSRQYRSTRSDSSGAHGRMPPPPHRTPHHSAPRCPLRSRREHKRRGISCRARCCASSYGSGMSERLRASSRSASVSSEGRTGVMSDQCPPTGHRW